MSLIVSIAAVYVFYKQTQLSPAEFSNQVAENLGLIEQNEELLLAKHKYPYRFLHLAVEQSYPRILNKEYSLKNNPHEYFREHINILNSHQENANINCDSDALEEKLSCFLYFGDSKPQQLAALQAGFEDFILEEPTEFAYSGNTWKFAYLYDISRSTASFDNRFIQQIDTRIAQILSIYLAKLDRQNASLWHGRASIASTAFLLATVLDLNKASNKSLYSRSYGHFLDLINAVEVAGTWPEGYDYWVEDRAHLIVLGLSTLMNHPSSPQRQRAFNLLTELGLSHIYLTRPDNVIEGYADEGSRVDLKDETRKIIDIIAKATNHEVILKYSVWLQKLHPESSYHEDYNWMKPYFISPQIFIDAYQSMNDPSTHLTEFDGILPTGKLFGKHASNHGFIRSDWSENATFITFKASDIFTHHQHYDAGHFTLFKHRPLITTSGTYGELDSEHRLNYALRTVSKNSILVMQANEHDTLLSQAVNDGGQRVIMPLGSAVYSLQNWLNNLSEKGDYWASSLIEAKLEGSTKLISADITPAYNDTHAINQNIKVNKATRSLVYLEHEDALIIHDLVTPEDDAYVVKSLYHTYNRPIVDAEERLIKGTLQNGISQSHSQQFLASIGDAKVFADIVRPLKAKLTLVGGVDYQYYVDIDGDEASVDGKNMLAGAKSDPWFESPLWRVEISEQFTSPTYKSLLVLQPRVNDTPKNRLLYYLNDASLTIFSIGETLIIYGNKPVKLDFLATSKISRVLIMGSDRSLTYKIASVDDCKSYQQSNNNIVKANLNIKKHARMQVQITELDEESIQCY